VKSQIHYFICGIGGSGMLPLAVILKGMGHKVSGSDRSYDQGRMPEKFQWIAAQGITLYPQDGSGVKGDLSAVIISKAVEDTIPDIAAAKARNVTIMKRADMLVELFNAAKQRIAVSGTSGKTTTTGMIGFLLKEAGMDPTVNNGGIFRNYVRDNPYSTAFVGKGDVFVSEIDESDGIEAVTSFEPDIAVIHNITLDHQPMEELKAMFSGFLAKTQTAVVNAEDPIVLDLAQDFGGKIILYSTNGNLAHLMGESIRHQADGVEADILYDGKITMLRLKVPGAHNVSNALAALAVGIEMGIPLARCVEILSRFEGIRRRMEVVGTKNNITVMDDFAHNPDKIAATIGTLRQFPGRMHIFFQPHGYGFLKMLGPELVQTFADHLSKDDRLYLVEPYYAGGTVDRSVGSSHIVDDIQKRGGPACLMADRKAVREAILAEARSGDRIIIMGARDDTLSEFAKEILGLLP